MLNFQLRFERLILFLPSFLWRYCASHDWDGPSGELHEITAIYSFPATDVFKSAVCRWKRQQIYVVVLAFYIRNWQNCVIVVWELYMHLIGQNSLSGSQFLKSKSNWLSDSMHYSSKKNRNYMILDGSNRFNVSSTTLAIQLLAAVE